MNQIKIFFFRFPDLTTPPRVVKSVLRAIFFFSTPFLYLMLNACQEEKKIIVKKAYNGPISEIYGVNMTYSDSARLVVRMSTESQLTLPNEDKVYPNEVRVFFFDKLGNNSTTLRSDSARYIRMKNVYHIMGRVLINNQIKHETLSTDELYWNPDTKKIYTEKPVDIKTPERIFHGVGMDSNQDFTDYKLRKVTGSLNIKTLP